MMKLLGKRRRSNEEEEEEAICMEEAMCMEQISFISKKIEANLPEYKLVGLIPNKTYKGIHHIR